MSLGALAGNFGVVGGLIVGANLGPTAAFTTTQTGLQVNVNAATSSDPDGSIAAYSWNFGDGTTATGVSASRTYASAGLKTITLTVTDGEGATSTVQRGVLVDVAAVVDAFPGTTLDPGWTALVGTWGVAANQLAPTSSTADGVVVRDFARADGTVSVKMAVAGGRLIFRATDASNYWMIQSGGIFRRVAGSFTSMGTVNFVAGDTVSVELNGASITAKVNGTTAVTVSHTHNQTATKHGAGSSFNTTARFDDFTVGPLPLGTPPTAAFTVSATTGEAPLAVTFTDASTGSPTSRAWDFGDGTTTTVTSPVHGYDYGTFTAKLTVTNTSGWHTVTRLIKVRRSRNPVTRLFTGLWDTRLSPTAPLEDRAAFNGTDDATNNRANTPYATRIAHIARYHVSSTPVAGLYAYGDTTITATDSAPLYIIPAAGHARQPIIWRFPTDAGNWDGSGSDAPAGTTNGLPEKFASVPVPRGPGGERFADYYARPLEAAGGDRQFVIYDPFTDELWEVFNYHWSATRNRHEMGYGAYTAQASTAAPAYPNTWGSRATGLPLHPSIIKRTAWEAGVIQHPISVGIQVVKPGFIAPAVRQDGILNTGTPADYWHTAGNDGRDAVPEGAWFRLPATYVVSENFYPGNAAKSKLWAMMVRAIRDYGMVITDGTGGTMTFSIEASNAIGTPYSSLASSTLPVQVDYNDGYYYGGQNLLKDVPWDDLVQVKYVAP